MHPRLPHRLSPALAAVAVLAGLQCPSAGDEIPRLSALAAEDSPHLRQYLQSPVDWQPWGPAAFERAEREGKPLFVSSGYFSCHWCAVMDREAFRDPETARLMNEKFINVKLDRFERPDIDRLYMRFIDNATRQSGWPLNVWATPDRLPVRGVAFAPAASRDQPTFRDAVAHHARLWDEESGHLRAQAPLDLDAFARTTRPRGTEPLALGQPLLNQAFSQISSQFDPVHGGFGRVPKFPSPARIEFLARHAAAQLLDSAISRECTNMIDVTLNAMARGGIRDHLTGGFFRYAFDEQWRRPYFEKMTLDQALTAQSYLTGHILTENTQHAAVALEILAYADRELSHPDGGFFNAEHCESLPDPGATTPRDGAYYVWEINRLHQAAGPAADLLEAVFGVRERGNIPPGADPFKSLEGTNLLTLTQPAAEAASSLGLDPQQADTLLSQGRASLREARAARPRPPRDDLLITQMNGAMISAFARAAMILGDESLLDRALRCARFVKQRLWHEPTHTLYRCSTERTPRHFACAEDYAYLIAAVLDLYEATGDHSWLRWGEVLQREFDRHHGDPAGGGYFDARADLADIPLRLKNDDDASHLSSNAVAGLNLVRWAALLSQPERLKEAERLLGAFSHHLARSPGAVAGLCLVAEGLVRPPARIILVGPTDTPEMALAREQIWAHSGRRPVIVQLDDQESRTWWMERGALPAAVSAPGPSAAAFLTVDGALRAGPFPLSELPKHLARRPRMGAP